MTARYRRREPLDVLEADGEALVLLPPDRVVRLSVVATAVYGLAGEAVTLATLAAGVEELFGVPPQGETEVVLGDVVDALIAAGVLERVDG